MAQKTQLPALTGPKPEDPNIPFLAGAALQVARLTEKLTRLIMEETKLLHLRKPQEAQKLHSEKNQAIAEYKQALSKLYNTRQILGPEDSPERQYIRRLTDSLKSALRDHARIVLRLKSITEGLVRSVTDEVNKTQRSASGYSRNANHAFYSQRTPTSLALNQVI